MRIIPTSLPIAAAVWLAAACSLPAAAGGDHHPLVRSATPHTLGAIAAPQGARRALAPGHHLGVHLAGHRHATRKRLRRHHGAGVERWWGRPPYVLHHPPRHRPPVVHRHAPPHSPPWRHHARRFVPKHPDAVLRHHDRRHRFHHPRHHRHAVRAKLAPHHLIARLRGPRWFHFDRVRSHGDHYLFDVRDRRLYAYTLVVDAYTGELLRAVRRR